MFLESRDWQNFPKETRTIGYREEKDRRKSVTLIVSIAAEARYCSGNYISNHADDIRRSFP